MLAIPGPENGFVLNRGGCDQGIGNFQTMASCVLAHQIASQFAGFIIGGQAGKKIEEFANECVLIRAGASPSLRSHDGGIQEDCTRANQTGPFRADLLVIAALNLYYDVCIEQNAHKMPNRFKREPFRKLRT